MFATTNTSMNKQNYIATRLGGENFDKQAGNKFRVIKENKQKFLAKNPEMALIDLGVGEPDEAAPLCVIEALKACCGSWDLRGYADNGADFFVAAIRRYMQRIFNVTLRPEEILPIMGIKSGLGLLAGTLVNPGDVVACTVPGYDVFATQTGYLGGQTILMELRAQCGFLPEIEALDEDVKRRIKVVQINYPNNPTGAVATLDFYRHLVDLACRYQWVIIQDAAYSALEFEERKSILQVPRANQCCVELHSMSKAFNMTGWRLGWICGNEAILRACAKYKSNCDSGQFLPIQKAATVALDQADVLLPPLRQKYQRRLEALLTILKKHNIAVFEPKGGLFIYAKAPTGVVYKQYQRTEHFANAAEFAQWLLSTLGVVVVPWDDCGSYVRFSATFATTNESLFLHQFDQTLDAYIFLEA